MRWRNLFCFLSTLSLAASSRQLRASSKQGCMSMADEETLKSVLNLPKATVGKIVRNALPSNGKMSTEGRKLVSRAASVFILYMSTHIASVAKAKKRTLISGDDAVEGIKNCDVEKVNEKLEKYVELFEAKKSLRQANAAQKRAERKTLKQQHGDSAAKSSECATGDVPDIESLPETVPI